MNIVSFDLPDGMDCPKLFCPTCGVQALSSEGEKYIDQPSCQHVRFLYVGVAGAFEYIARDLEEQISGLRNESSPDDFLSDHELLQRILKDDRRSLVIEMSTPGIACGPVSSTVCIGFQFFD